MNEDGEADANDLALDFETDQTRQKIRRGTLQSVDEDCKRGYSCS